MKRAMPILLVLLAGCLVQSFSPFYTAKSKVSLPQLNGDWDAIMTWGSRETDTNAHPWQISNSDMTAYDGQSASKLEVTFFKLGHQLFCDSKAGAADNDRIGTYWVWHVRPLHSVTEVETNGDVLTFKPLDLGWLTNQMALGKVSLPHISRAEDDDWPLFTATPEQWEAFLTAHANDTDAFLTNHIYILKRHLPDAVKKTAGN